MFEDAFLLEDALFAFLELDAALVEGLEFICWGFGFG